MPEKHLRQQYQEENLLTGMGILKERLDHTEVGSTAGGHKEISKSNEVSMRIILSICTFYITFFRVNFGILDNNSEVFVNSRQVGR